MPNRSEMYMVPWDHGAGRWSRDLTDSNECVRFACYWPRCARALRSGALEICISPWKGLYISRIKKIAPETDSAQTHKVARAVALRGANKRKLVKMVASQKPSTASNGMETKLPACSNIIQRIFPISIPMLNAWAWSER